MTDENFLNQNDIDALMQGLGGDEDSAGGGGDSEAGGGQPQPEDIRPALEMILRQASTVISTVLNKTCELSIREMRQADAQSIWGEGERFKTNSLSMKVSFVSGVEGNLYFIISHQVTALLADLMMMGDGTAEFEDDHKDALVELGNQIMGAVCTAMGTEYGVTITTDQAVTSPFEENNLPFELEGLAQAAVTVKIEDFDDSEILLLTDDGLTRSFASRYESAAAPVDTSSEEAEEPSLSVPEGQNLSSGPDFSQDGETAPVYASTGNPNIDMLLDIPLDVAIELGRANLSIRKILELGPGSIVELDRKASEPVDLLVNNKVVAKGEVVVVDEYFGIRIISLISPEERIKHLR
jgi:flagellar motor switch protein FliN/FliY